MKLNVFGERCAGIGGTTVSYNGTPIASPAGSANWMDNDHIVYQVCATIGVAPKRTPSFAEYQQQMRHLHSLNPRRPHPRMPRFRGVEVCRVERYNVRTGEKDTVLPFGANFIEANGGISASWLGTSDPNAVGITVVSGSSIVARFPNSGLGPVGPDGAVAIKDDYQSWGPWSVIEQNGARWQLTSGDAVQINLLGNGRAVFAGFGGWTGINMPVPKVIGGAWWLRVAAIAGEWWALYQVEDGRLILHPFTSSVGYELAPPGSLTYRPDLVVLPTGLVRVVWAAREDEGPDVQRLVDVDIALPRMELSKPVQPKPDEPKPDPGGNVPTPTPQGITDEQFNDLKAIRARILGTSDENAPCSADQRARIFNEFAYKHRNDPGARLGLQRDMSDPKMFQPKTGIPLWNGIRIIDKDGNHWGEDICGACSAGLFRPVRATPGKADVGGDNGWVDPVPPDGDEPDQPAPTTHLYVGGGNDTGTCDVCGKSRFDPVHAVPASKEKHGYDGGEQDTGLCDICQKPRTDSIHDLSKPDEPEEPTVQKHEFVGSGKFCSECGKPKSDPIHDMTQPVPGGTVDMTATNAILNQILAEQKITNQKLDQLRTETSNGLSKAAAELIAALKLGNIFKGAEDEKPHKK